jgi:zinc protease
MRGRAARAGPVARALSGGTVALSLAALLTMGRSLGARGLSASAAALAPGGTAARVEADTSTAEFSVDGLRVILRRNTANDVVAANLFLLGGVQQLTIATQGIEPFLLAVSERGTAHYPKDALRTAMNRTGSVITIETEDDWTVFGLHAIRSTFDSSWAVFADRVMHPSLDSIDIELVRAQLLAAVRQGRLHPDAELRIVADSLLFVGHPYSLSPDGTASSLGSITRADLRSYLATQFVRSRMLLVVVGNVDRPRLESLVRSTLSTLPLGSYHWTAPPPARSDQRGLVVESQSLPTNYIIGYYAGPPASSNDYNALRIATAVLSGRFFTEIRSKRNLSYAVEAPFVERAVAAGGVYVTTVEPEQALRLMRAEITELQNELVDPDGLRRLVQQFITDYFLKNETNADQAAFLARAAVYEGDYRAANRFVDDLRRIRPDDIRRVAREYMRNFRFVYIGDPEKLPTAYLNSF